MSCERMAAGVFAPVSPAVWAFAVSGLKVVQSWLGYLMAERRGKSSSELDEIRPERWTPALTTQLLELLWVIEATAGGYERQAALLERIVSGPLIEAAALPRAPEPMRSPPRGEKPAGQQQMF